MKNKTITTLILFFVFFSSWAQQEQKEDSKEKDQFLGLKYTLYAGETVYFKDGGTLKKRNLVSNLKFKKIDEDGDTIFIKFKKITKESSSFKNYIKKQCIDYGNIVNSENYKTDYFLLRGKKQSFNYKYFAVVTGILTAPIKFRFKQDSIPFTFNTDISVGPYIGAQFGRTAFSSNKTNNITHTFAIFATPTMVMQNPSNSTGTENNALLAFSSGLTYLFAINTFQIGVMGGIDFVSGSASKNWVYHGKPWFSLGIGKSFTKN